MADNISLKCRHWTKNKPIEMIRLFKKVYDSHVAETIALEPHSNYLSLRILTNLKFTQGNVHPAGYFVQKMAKVSCMLEAGWSITGTGNGNQQVSLSVRIVWSGFVFQMLVKYIWCHSCLLLWNGKFTKNWIGKDLFFFKLIHAFLISFPYQLNICSERKITLFLHNCSLGIACHLNI